MSRSKYQFKIIPLFLNNTLSNIANAEIFQTSYAPENKSAAMPQATRLIRLSILIFYASILISLTSISLCNAESDYLQRRLRDGENPRPEPLNRDESNADWFRKSSFLSGDGQFDGSHERKRTPRAAPNRNWFGRSSFRRNIQGKLPVLVAKSYTIL